MFLHKVDETQVAREKLFQLASIVQNADAVGLFATDIPYGTEQLSRFGVEETVVDGVLLLTSREEGLERERYIEVYKLRNTAHLKGRHNLTIGSGGITIFPRYSPIDDPARPPAPLDVSSRVPSGVPGFDELVRGGLLERSVTLLSGSPGVGKSTFAVQFALAGAALGHRTLYVALEEGPAQLVASAAALGLPLAQAVDDGLVDMLYLPREIVRPNQLLALLTERLNGAGARRLVIDSVSHVGPRDDLHALLHALSARFKSLGVTTLLTYEARALLDVDWVTEEGFSAVADNIVMLRYRAGAGELRPMVTVIKTRGSAHDRASHALTIGEGGLRVVGGASRPAKAAAPVKRKPPRAKRAKGRGS